MVKNFKKHKRAQSQIITTVLLILIVISIALILINFVVPFVKKQLSNSDCLEVMDSVSIENNKRYTCYDEISNADDETRVQIRVGENKSLHGFVIELSGGGSSNSYKIINEGRGVTDNVKNYGEEDGDPLIIPGKNQQRTYIIVHEGKPYSIRVYPMISSEKSCDSSDINNEVPFCTPG